MSGASGRAIGGRPRRRRACAPGALALAACLGLAPPAGAQDFAFPSAAPGLGGDPLERALPAPAAGVALRTLHVGRTAGLTTRTLAGEAGFGVVRLAAGLSRTGDESLGWSTAAGAAGFALDGAGAMVRGVVRRDDAAPAGEDRHGLELGAGAWVASPAGTGWISVPQGWLARLAPPLARGLAAGFDVVSGDVTASLSREAPRRGFAEGAAWSARLALDLGVLAVWGEWRDHPWRGGVGLRGAAGPLECSAQVDAHPVLDPTVRIAIGVRPGRLPR